MRHNMTLEKYIESLYDTLENFHEDMESRFNYDYKLDIGEWDQIFLEFFSKSIEE